MRTGMSVARSNGVFTHPGIQEGGVIPFEVFEKCGLPPVVYCTGCEMSMALLSPSCLVDDNNQVWCRDCAALDPEDEPTQEISADLLESLRAASHEAGGAA